MKKKLFTFLMTLILLTGSGTWAQAQTKGTHTFRLGDNQFWFLPDFLLPAYLRFDFRCWKDQLV